MGQVEEPQVEQVERECVLGKDLKVGDTIKVWWKPGRDTILDLVLYRGPLKYLWEDYDGDPRLAKFAINPTGMTIEPQMYYEIVARDKDEKARTSGS